MTTVVHARWILPMTIDGERLEHAAIAFDQHILDVLPSDLARDRFPRARHITLDHHVLLPGFVNAHTHAAMSLLRGAGSDCALQTWLEQHIWPLEGRLLSEAFVRDGTQLAIAEMLRSGTTTFADMYLFPEAAADAIEAAGIRAVLTAPVIDFPTPYARSLTDYLARARALAERLCDHPMLTAGLGPHAPYTVGDASLAAVLELASDADLAIQMHVHETQAEIDRALAETGERPITRLARLGAFTRPFQAVHMTALDQDDIVRVVEHGVRVVHCVESNLKLASGFCPVAKLTRAGVAVALGTDGAASNNDLDLLGEARTAALVAKAVAGDATVLSAYDTLALMTREGARVLGLDEAVGTLEAGMQADLIAIDLDCIETWPEHDPAAAILYASNRNQIKHVWVAGRHLLEDRLLTSIDEDALRATAQRWAETRA